MNVIKNLGNSMGKGSRAFLTGLMLLTSNQLFQACKTTDSNITPVDTLTPLQAAKNAMRTKLEAQYGSIDKIMEKGLNIVVYMSYPDTKTPEQSFTPKIYAQLQNPVFVAQLNQIYTDLMQPYLKGIKVNLDFQFLPLTKDDIGNMYLDPNDKTNATIGENATLRTGIGKKLNAKFLDYNKTQMKIGAPMSPGFAFYYDTGKIGVNGVQGGFDVPIDNNGVKYTACGINTPMDIGNNGVWSLAKLISHEILGHGLTDLGIVMHAQDSYYLGKKISNGSYEIVGRTGNMIYLPGSNNTIWQYKNINGNIETIPVSEMINVIAINQSGLIDPYQNGSIMIGGFFDPKIIGSDIIGYKINPDGTLDKKLVLRLPEVVSGFALPKVDDTMKGKVMDTAGTFIASIVNDVKAP